MNEVILKIEKLPLTDSDKKILSQKKYYDSFIKSTEKLIGIYELRKSVSIELHGNLPYGIETVLSSLNRLSKKSKVRVHIYVSNKDNLKTCALFTDSKVENYYGLINNIE